MVGSRCNFWNTNTKGQASFVGLFGDKAQQLDMMPPEVAEEYLEQAAKYFWDHKGSFSEQVERLCDHYNAPCLYQALSESAGPGCNWDKLKEPYVEP